MKTVWKTQLLLQDEQEIEVPSCAEFLCADSQFEQVCVWYRCDPAQAMERRTIIICGTGHPAPEPINGRHLGSVKLKAGAFVWHVFLKERR